MYLIKKESCHKKLWIYHSGRFQSWKWSQMHDPRFAQIWDPRNPIYRAGWNCLFLGLGYVDAGGTELWWQSQRPRVSFAFAGIHHGLVSCPSKWNLYIIIFNHPNNKEISGIKDTFGGSNHNSETAFTVEKLPKQSYAEICYLCSLYMLAPVDKRRGRNLTSYCLSGQRLYSGGRRWFWTWGNNIIKW